MSNKTVLCNLTQNQYRALTLAYGSTGLVTAITCGLILAFLLLVLKKKAWESPVKRLNLVLTISIALSSLTFALAGFYTSPSRGWCVAIGFLKVYWYNSIIFYFTALLVALLLQVSAPIVPDRWKRTQKYIPKAKYIEGIAHILIPTLTLLLNIPINQHIYNHCDISLCERLTVFYEVVGGILVALSIIVLFVIIIIFSSFFFRFYRTQVVTRKTIWAMIRLSVVFVIGIYVLIDNTVSSRIEKELNYNNIIIMVVETLLLLLFVMLIYLPSTQCCKCHKRTSDQLPVLPNTDVHTNPLSEWDHSNVPSITVSVHPNEMSDCKTDYVSSLTIPAPKYGSTN